jgi:hypothetical protein
MCRQNPRRTANMGRVFISGETRNGLNRRAGGRLSLIPCQTNAVLSRITVNVARRERRSLATAAERLEVERLRDLGTPIRRVAELVFGDARYRGRVERIMIERDRKRIRAQALPHTSAYLTFDEWAKLCRGAGLDLGSGAARR